MLISGKTALIVGGGQGIGRAIAERFANAQALVAIADIAVDRAQDAAKELGSAHFAVPVDVTVEASVKNMVDLVLARTQRIDVLVHCVGASLKTQNFWEIDLDDWRRILDVNVNGTLFCCREVARAMIRQRCGSIITIGSVAGILAQRGGVPYGASKAAVAHMTRIMAHDLAEYGVRANVIAPGPVIGPMTQLHGTERMAIYASRIPMKRMSQASEIAGAALYLASDEASFTTGHVLTVDGGFTISGMQVF